MPAIRINKGLITTILLLATLLAGTGCGGSSSGTAGLVGDVAAGVENSTDEAANRQPEAPGLGGLPQDAWVDPAEILKRRGSELKQRIRPGSDYYAKSANVTVGNGIAALYPGGNAGGAWVLYSFDSLLAADYPIKVTTEFQGGASVPDSCYLGVSDYGQRAWDWQVFDMPGTEISAYLPEDGSAISPGGNLYVVLMVLGENIAAISQLVLELDTDDPPPPVLDSVSQGTYADKITLAWADPAETYPGLDYIGVLLARAPSRIGPWTQLAELPVGTLEYTDTQDMEPGLQWFYRLRTKTIEHTGWAGNTGYGWPAVGAVELLNASDWGWNRIRLTWSPVEHAASYRIEYMGEESYVEPNEWTTLVEVDASADTTFDHSATEPSGETIEQWKVYRYRVWAMLDGKPSLDAPVDTGSFYSGQALNLTATSSPEVIELSWSTTFLGTTGYTLEYMSASAGPAAWTLLADLPAAVTTFEHRENDPPGLGCEYHEEYWYRIRPYNAAGQVLDWCDMVSGKRGVPQVTGAATLSRGDSIQARWVSTPGVEGYQLEYMDFNGVDPADWTQLAAGPVAGFFLYSGLDGFNHMWDSPVGHEARPGYSYTYRVRAYLGEEYSPDWTELTAGTRQPVGDIASFTASEDSASRVRFDVDNGSQATGVKIEYRNLDGGDPVDWTLLQMNAADHTATSPVGRECAAYTTYEYRAKGTAGDIEGENWISDTGWRGMSDVAELTATDGWFQDRITLAWTGIDGVDGYLIEYRDIDGVSPVAWTVLVEPSGFETVSFDHTPSVPVGLEAEAGITYEYRIKASYGAELSGNWAEDTGSLLSGGPRWSMEGGNARRNWRTGFTGPETPVIKWTLEDLDNPPVVGNGGTLYLGSWSSLAAVDPEGDIAWQRSRSGSWNALLDDGNLVVGGTPLSALDPAGNLLWEHVGSSTGSITIGSGSMILTTATAPGGMTAQAFAADGMLVWDYNTGANSVTLIAQGPEGNIYFGADGDLVALDTAGSLLWTYPTGDTKAMAPSVADDGTVFLFSTSYSGATLHAVHPDGSVYWTEEHNWNVSSSSFVAVAVNGTAYMRLASTLYAYAPGGALVWTLPINGLGPGPLLIDAAGTIYAVAQSCDLHAVNPDGTLKWTLPLASATATTPYAAVIGGDGLIYAVSTNDSGGTSLFAVGEAP